jgi:hypothetical protein
VTLKLHVGATTQPEPYGAHTPANEVLDILEANYGLATEFVRLHQQEIADLAAQAMERSLSGWMRGDKSPKYAAFYDAGNKLTTLFQHDLQTKKFDHLPGVPTEAAREGKVFFGRTVINKRSGKAGKKCIPGRPSFIFSMNLLNSLRVFFTDSTGQWAPRKPPGD